MCRVDADIVHQLGTDAIDRLDQRLAHSGRQDSSRDGDATQVRHLVCAHNNALARVGSGRRSEDQVKGVLGVYCQTANLGRVLHRRFGYGAGLLAVAVHGEADEVGRGELNRVPLEDNTRLGGIATT